MAATSEMHGSEAITEQVWEEVARLGNGGANELLAIVSKPSHLRAERPIVMVLNAGVLHRVGPHRFHVSLARRVAQHGLCAVRLDLGGLGDSPAPSRAGTFTESAVADVRAAMTDLEQRFGVRRFVLFGLCSGADNGIAAALVDERIAGLVLLDPHSYRTRRSQLRKISKRVTAMRNPMAVARWGFGTAARGVRQQASARLARLKARFTRDSDSALVEPPAQGREPPPQETFRAQLAQLVDREVKVLAIFSGAYGDRYNHRDQWFELFPELRGRIDHEYFPAANHMFTERAAQQALLTTATTWLSRHFAASAS
jgi:alpha-beta hydrolase superfamily lysophospholipase